MNSKTKYGREITDDFGMTAGVICPHCGGREYPYGNGGKLAKCSSCGNVYLLPLGYNFRARNYQKEGVK